MSGGKCRVVEAVAAIGKWWRKGVTVRACHTIFTTYRRNMVDSLMSNGRSCAPIPSWVECCHVGLKWTPSDYNRCKFCLRWWKTAPLWPEIAKRLLMHHLFQVSFMYFALFRHSPTTSQDSNLAGRCSAFSKCKFSPFRAPLSSLCFFIIWYDIANNVNFDPSIIKVRHRLELEGLKRPNLDKLCFFYGLSAAGKYTLEIIARCLLEAPQQKISW